MMLAIGLGAAVHNLMGTPAWARPGAAFCVRWILRGAITLLGLQLTVQQMRETGVTSLAIIAATVLASFLFTKWMGRLLGVERKLAELIAEQ